MSIMVDLKSILVLLSCTFMSSRAFVPMSSSSSTTLRHIHTTTSSNNNNNHRKNTIITSTLLNVAKNYNNKKRNNDVKRRDVNKKKNSGRNDNGNYFDMDQDPYGHDDDDDDNNYSYSDNDYYNNNNDDDDMYNDTYDRDSSLSTSPITTSSTSKHFFSQKPLNDPHFSIIQSSTFQQLCNGASITNPSRIQALAWPTLLKGKNCIVADQTGSGKTLSYLIPLLQRIIDANVNNINNMNKYSSSSSSSKERGNGCPKVLILAPTAELADQIKIVCDRTTSLLNDHDISTRVITATGSHSTNIRDQIRMLASQKVDVLVSTPGRIATILRTKNTSLDLSHLQSIVLDEVDVLLIDDTFGPQLRTIGAAAPVSAVQFVFVTATLPDEIVDSVKREFDNVEVIQGPGLHRIALNLKEHLVDVSVPPSSNKNLDLCFEYKAKELMKALRANRCKRTLVFCNTVESCRRVENLVRRNDRKQTLWIVGAYHNAMNPESRRKNLNIFVQGLKEKRNVDHVLVCTDRAARGVDFDSSPVDHVVIFDFPKDPAEYVRRVGRTARAGRVGSSTVFAFAWQLPIARKIMGSKLESFTVASQSVDDDLGGEEFTQKERRQRRQSLAEKDKMIRGNIKSGKLWK